MRLILNRSNTFKNASCLSFQDVIFNVFTNSRQKYERIQTTLAIALTASHCGGDCSHTCWECEVTNFKPCTNEIVHVCTPTPTFVFFIYILSHPFFACFYTLFLQNNMSI